MKLLCASWLPCCPPDPPPPLPTVFPALPSPCPLQLQPLLNGRSLAHGSGFMLLDTGASGFVLTPQAAAELGSDRFGELYAASMSGKVATHFVRARSWALGPLEVSEPVMMTMKVKLRWSGLRQPDAINTNARVGKRKQGV